ncbi:hypothetical protein F7725_017766 [Dissostichus mawsoni]|uniref:Integrase core domain-containing protein n=1 Tax=Dissostichus mawsoni TaxID=36200 RepID=A0A7J5XR43_DISMA|nr:hypothetical protein F7725_017766 [Dissostichus mawsoni]
MPLENCVTWLDVRWRMSNIFHLLRYRQCKGQGGDPNSSFNRTSLDRHPVAQALIDTQLPIPCVAKLLGVSEVTVFRRMAEFGISVSGSYSTMSDQELDMLVSEIKAQMPQIGYRLVMGRLRSLGHRVQWSRMKAAMHRVDAAGILARCVVRRTYSVRASLSLVHVDTNHKLISCKINAIMYLEPANNNKASTGFTFFLTSCERNGLPSGSDVIEVWRMSTSLVSCSLCEELTGQVLFQEKVSTTRARVQAASTLCIAALFCSIVPCGPMTLPFFHDRIKRLWRDVWTAVTSTYYDVCTLLKKRDYWTSQTRCTFPGALCVPTRLRSDLHTFTEVWNHHPLRTEGSMTPRQLWPLGLLQNSTDEAENVEDLQELDIDWESALYCDESLQESGLVVPELPTPINEQDMADLQAAVDPTDPSDSHGRDIYCRCLQIFQ